MIRDAARSYATDRYLAALLAPRHVRDDLIALAAFFGDLSRIPLTVSDPLIGEIRLQWWRDALAALRAGEQTGNPLADAFAATLVRHDLSEDELTQVIEGVSIELGTDGSAVAPDAGLIASERAASALVARILGAELTTGVSELLNTSAQSMGRVRFLRSLPLLRRSGRVPQVLAPPGAEHGSGECFGGVDKDARSALERSRTLVRSAPKAVFPAILPLALVEPYLAALENQGPGHDHQIADIAPLTRVWRLWFANVLGRV